MLLNPDKIRLSVLEMVYNAKSGHIGGSFSIAEVIAYIYSNFKFFTKTDSGEYIVDESCDRLILSKGHAVPAIYAALYELGAISTLDNFREIDSPLQGHPDKCRLPLVHATTGSLGQGLSIAVGHALAMKKAGSDRKVFCIVGDGECQEGQILESAMIAARLKIDNLILFVDYNGMQCDGKSITDMHGFYGALKSFRWNVNYVSGNDIDSIAGAIGGCGSYPLKGNPDCIILETKKGFPIDFMIADYGWHARVPSEKEYLAAKKELEARIGN